MCYLCVSLQNKVLPIEENLEQMIYSYEAKNEIGHTVTGSLSAPDERTAVQQVRALGFFPIRVAASGGSERNGVAEPQPVSVLGQNKLLQTFVYPLWSGVAPMDLAICYRQWATLIGAGVPLFRSLSSLAMQTRSGALQRALKQIAKTVEEGGTLSDGMARFPWIFSEFHRAMIRSGETTGGLDTTFRRLADAAEQEIALRRTLQRETLMPKITLVLSFLLPPLFYLFLGGIKAYISHAVLPLLALAGAGLAFYIINRLGMQQKRGYDTFTANVPGIGGTVRLIALARFARALASLYGAGIDMPQAIKEAAEACGNAFLGTKMILAIPDIEAGQGLAWSLGKTGAFPPMVVSMIQTGEETGSLDAMMDKVAEHYEQDAVVRLHQTSVAAGTATMLIAGVIVGAIVVQFYTGYFTNILKPE